MGNIAQSSIYEPLITIITVCWNSAQTIEQAIQSVLNQTYKNIEYLIVDGNSTDGTVDILHKYEDKIDYYVSEPDDGLYYAMNKGLELAQGDYILILNSDDWYVPDCVESLLRASAESHADFVSGLANYVDADGKFLHLQPNFSFNGATYILMPLRHETMFLPRRIYERVGPFDLTYRVIADRVFTNRLYEMGYTHHLVPRALMNFRNTGVSSANLDALRAERRKILAHSFPFLNQEDIDSLASFEVLEPNQLETMLKRHAHPRLSHAMADLVADWKRRKHKKWVNADIGTLRAYGASSNKRSRLPLKQRMLRVATFTTFDSGGAGVGTQRRVAALRFANVDARIYCLFRNSQYPHVFALTANIPGVGGMKRSEVLNVWRERTVVTKEVVKSIQARELFVTAESILDFRKYTHLFNGSDIVHMHWMSGMFDFDHSEVLRNRPVAWTLADMNAFTGGCHYSERCNGYQKDCRNCPLLGRDGADLAHKIWQKKRDAYAKIRNLHIICPSKWLADCVRESSLFRDRPVHMIPNALPVNRFTPTNKVVARIKLGLPLGKKLVLFGAESLANGRKGGDMLVQSIRHLKKMDQAKDVEGVFFGKARLDLGITSHNMGHFSDETKLSLIYAAADVFAFPSREDNAPLTLAEAMLSGTPVVAFRGVGNASELICHKETGYLAHYEDPEDFAKGLAWVLAESRSSKALSRGLRCCLAVRKHNDPDVSAARHLQLYQSMLKE